MRSWLGACCLFSLALADLRLLNNYATFQSGAFGTSPNQTYRSSNITSPLFNYNTWRKDLLAGDETSHVFLTLKYDDGAGPYIFRDDDLSLVYADTSFGTTMNARVQTVDDTDYLTFWHGDKNGGHGKGHCVFYDDKYELKYNLSIRDPLSVDVDMHECQVTETGTVLLTAYQDKPYNLSSLHFTGDDILADSCFQEIDIATNDLIFSWCASDHFHHDLTYQNYTKRADKRQQYGTHIAPDTGVDAYHINSLQKTREGNYLVSLRPLGLITYIDGTTGKPIWNLNGKVNNFTDITAPAMLAANPNSGGALSFGWQHHARFTDDTLTQITLFDNHELTTTTGCEGPSCSRGRRLHVDTSDPANLTVQLLQDYWSPQGLGSIIMGSMHSISPGSPYSAGSTTNAGNVFIGWGANAEFGEFTSNGEIVRDVQFSVLDPRNAFGGLGGITSYRAYKQSWKGYPTWPPSIAGDVAGTIYVSWNGATEVRQWAVYGSENEGSLGKIEGTGYDADDDNKNLMELQPVHLVQRAGFETEIMLGIMASSFVKVAAMDSNGKITGTTKILQLRSHDVGCGLACIMLESILLA